MNHAPKLGTYRLDHDSISREHAAVVSSFDGSWFITDHGSRYGTHVNGAKLEAKKYVPLGEGASIKFGESTRSFVFSLKPPAAPAPPRAASPPPAPDAGARRPSRWLSIIGNSWLEPAKLGARYVTALEGCQTFG